ncbi:MAG: hypothetical protein ACKE9I_07185 [Methylophagaceae bacterium]
MKSINKRHLLITLLPSILILVIVAIVSIYFNVKIPLITRDVAAIGKINPLYGILSSLGVLLWCVTASVCFFSAMILKNIGQANNFWFLLNSAFLSSYLMLDDLFLFHESLASMYFGINEKVVFVILGLVVFAYLTKYRLKILKTNYSVLLLALGFLSLSVVIDTVLEQWLWRTGSWKFFIEDGFKWLGIVSWCSYYMHTSLLLIINKPKKLLNDKYGVD